MASGDLAAHLTSGVKSGADPRRVVAATLVMRTLIAADLVLFVLAVLPRFRELAQLAEEVRASGEAASIHALLGLYPFLVLSLELIFVLGFALVAALIWGRGREPRALLFGLIFLTYSIWVTPTLDALVLPGGLNVVNGLLQGLGVFLATQFFLIFPDGRYVPSWTRVSAPIWAGYCLAWGLHPDAAYSLIDPFKASVGPYLALLLGGWGVGLLAQGVRYARASDEQRTQTRWVLAALVAACSAYGGVYAVGLVVPAAGSGRVYYELFSVPLFWLLALPLLIAIVVAMMRHELFDVRFVLRRTVVYAVLTNVLAGAYVATATLLRYVFAPLTGESRLAVAGSTLVVAGIFQPLRRRLQFAVDTRFNRTPYDAAQTVETFRRHVSDEVELDVLTDHLLRTVSTTLQPAHASVWLRGPRGGSGPSD
ncbi:MAG: hypothetical protein ACR2MA_12580 [Egibacteraceae bacterium]